MVIFPPLYIYILIFFTLPNPGRRALRPPFDFDRPPSPSHHFSIQTSLSFHSKLLNRVGYSEIGMVCSICSSWSHFSPRVFRRVFRCQRLRSPAVNGGKWWGVFALSFLFMNFLLVPISFSHFPFSSLTFASALAFSDEILDGGAPARRREVRNELR